MNRHQRSALGAGGRALGLAVQIVLSILMMVLLTGCTDDSGKIQQLGGSGFGYYLSPNPLAIGRGATGTVTVKIKSKVNINDKVALSVTGLPAGVTGTFDVALLPETSDTGLLRLQVASSAMTGQYSPTVHVTEQGQSESTQSFELDVLDSSGPDFLVSTPGIDQLQLGPGPAYTLNINVRGFNGFVGDVTLAVAGVPSELSVSGPTPSRFHVQGNGAFKASLTVQLVHVPPAARAIPLTITGQSGNITHDVTVMVNVPGNGQDFTIAVAPTVVSLVSGTSANLSVTLKSVNGFSDLVDLSLFNAPPSIRNTFTPDTVTVRANGSATITLNIDASFAVPTNGPVSVRVVARSGVLAHEAIFALTITPPPTGSGQIVFTQNDTVFLMNGDGSNPINLTSGNADSDPRFSADGQWIVFSRQNGNASDIWLMHADGSSPTRISPMGLSPASPINATPSFSPDGSKILFIGDATGFLRIAVMNRDGSSAHYLTDPTITAQSAGFSPDGRTILFGGRAHGQDFSAINLMNADGSNPHLIYSRAGHDLDDPRFSPDGSHIVFVDVSGPTKNLFIIDANGGNARQLTTNGQSQEPAFTGSGRIVFDRLDDAQIYEMDASGANLTQLTHSVRGVNNRSPDSL